MNEGISASDLSKIHPRSGIANPDLVITKEEREQNYQNQYKSIFAQCLNSIATQSQKLNNSTSQLDFFKALLPVGFENPQILSLARALRFSHADELESRAWKFFHLAYLISDMYDKDNNIATNLGLPNTVLEERLTKDQTSWLVTESLDQAVIILENITAPKGREIDYELSLAHLHILKLRKSHQSFAHLLGDFAVHDGSLELHSSSKQTVKTILRHLENAEKLLNKEDLVLPTIYQQDIYQMAQNLSDDEKYELIKMHKKELDDQANKEAKNNLEELNEARGFNNAEDNPLHYFTKEKIETITKYARDHELSEEYIEQFFIENNKKNYSIKKVQNPALYFKQDVLQRFLEKSGKISREELKQKLLIIIDNLRKTTLESVNNSV